MHPIHHLICGSDDSGDSGRNKKKRWAIYSWSVMCKSINEKYSQIEFLLHTM